MPFDWSKIVVNLWHAGLAAALAYITVINPEYAALAPLFYAAGAQAPPANLKPGS